MSLREHTVTADSPHHCHTPRFDAGNPLAESGIRRAMWLTLAMMVVEIAGGWYYNSMAVLADGWHMSSHALALGLSAFAYWFARQHAANRRYAFGTWKVEVLGGYSSAIILLGVALLMAWQSIARLISPETIHYDDAIIIAVVGLGVNLLCAYWLRDRHGHSHGHDHHHDHASHEHDHRPARHGHSHEPRERSHAHTHAGASGDHQDLNVRSAYMHVLADAATSVFAIVALFGGKLFGFAWLDPAMGVAGAVLVAVWAQGLLRDSARVLLDAEMDAPVVRAVRAIVEQGKVPARITDLHVWRVGRSKYACVLSIETSANLDGDYFRREICANEELAHVTVEVEHVRA